MTEKPATVYRIARKDEKAVALYVLRPDESIFGVDFMLNDEDRALPFDKLVAKIFEPVIHLVNSAAEDWGSRPLDPAVIAEKVLAA